MKHFSVISRKPARAQSVCTNLQNDLQVQLCFLSELLTSFFLPLFQIKNPDETQT